MMFFNVKQVIQELVVPELKEIKSEQKTILIEIKRIDEKIDGLRSEMKTEIHRVDEKIDRLGENINRNIDSLRSEVKTEIHRLDEKIDLSVQIRERLATIESKVALMGR